MVALVDSEVTHNLVSTGVATRLDLKLCKDASKLKVVNSEALETQGLAKDVAIQISEWKGTVNMLSTPLDDFDLILGNEFFVKAKVMVLPHLNGLLFMNETQPCFVRGLSKVPKIGKSFRENRFFVIQVEKGLEVSQKTYAETLMGTKSDYDEGIPYANLQGAGVH